MTSVQWFIARRYFGSRTSVGAVNILGMISMLGIVACTVALVVVLSAFNGLEQFSRQLYNAFDPELKVVPAGGKYLTGADSMSALLGQIDQIKAYSFVLEEKAYLQKGDREVVAILKGVDAHYFEVNDLEAHLLYGKASPGHHTAIVGLGVAYHLGLSAGLEGEYFQVFVPRADVRSLSRPERAFSQSHLEAVGIFTIQPEVDEKYCLTDITTLRELTRNEDSYSAIEIQLKNPAHIKSVKNKLRQLLSEHRVYDRDEQQEAFFKIMRAEKLVVYLIFTFIALLASFGLMGSLRMLILEKRHNIHLLRALGLTTGQISGIFRITGLLIVSAGVVIGILLGIGIVWLQDAFGLIQLGEGYLIEAYPVELRPRQLLLISFTVLAIGLSTTAAAVAGLPKILQIAGRVI
ncbi:ABC transporter permease [Schleiferia thermophila]|uniref:ABC transporter permease n=1 Tax=Schleiferia thermophila TaxID=884107 RepID=UPI0012679704|nr:FtsX-like permease family protein [Schleiferia thermophila]